MEKSLAVAYRALDAVGIDPGGLVPCDSGGFHVFTDGAVVVKVGRYGNIQDYRRASRGLRISRHMRNPGITTLPLHHEVMAIDGFPVTVWEHCEHTALPETMDSVRLVAADVHRLWEAMPNVKRTAVRELRKRFKHSSPGERVSPELRELGRLVDDMEDGFLRPLKRLVAGHRSASVATHGDLHVGNVLVTATGFKYIDFDDVVLAPRERDLGVLFGVPLRRGEVSDGVAEEYIREQESRGFDGDLIAVFAMNIMYTAFEFYLRDQDTPKAERVLGVWYSASTMERARSALASVRRSL